MALPLHDLSPISLYTLTKLTGHKTLSMAKRYAHLTDKTVRDAAKTLENDEESVSDKIDNPAEHTDQASNKKGESANNVIYLGGKHV